MPSGYLDRNSRSTQKAQLSTYRIFNVVVSIVFVIIKGIYYIKLAKLNIIT